jgi:hypothetical protein
MSGHLLSAAHTSSSSATAFIFTFGIAYVCGLVAHRKGRNRYGWFIVGVFFSIFALVAVLVMPRPRTRAEAAIDGPDPDPSHRAQRAPTPQLRHTRTVAFPVRDVTSGDHIDTDEIEAWLRSQGPPEVG